jgi:hypothetical protein
MHFAVDDSAAWFDHFKPIHVTNGFRSFLDRGARGLSETFRGSTDELNEFVDAGHAFFCGGGFRGLDSGALAILTRPRSPFT